MNAIQSNRACILPRTLLLALSSPRCMRRRVWAAAIVATTIGLSIAGTTTANHATPRPFEPEFNLTYLAAFGDHTETIENAAPAAGSGRNLILGWFYDHGDPDHPWISFDATENFINATYNHTVWVYNSSTLNLIGSTGGTVRAYDNSRVIMTGGALAQLETNEASTFVMNGGQVLGSIENYSTGSITISSGSKVDGNVSSKGSGSINIADATVGELSLDSNGRVSMLNSVLDGNAFLSANATGSIDLESVAVKGNLTAFGGTVTADSTDFGSITASGQSIVSYNNASVLDDVTALGETGLTIGNAHIGGVLLAGGDSFVKMNGGGVENRVFASDNSTVILSAGSFNNGISVYDTATANMNGGGNLSVAGAYVSGSATFNLTGGIVAGTVAAEANGRVNMSGGQVSGDLAGTGSSITTMSGGIVAGFPVFSAGSAFAWFGGTFLLGAGPGAAASAGGDDGLRVASGGVEPFLGLSALDNSRIEIYGHDLQYTLVDPNFQGQFSLYELTGQLADGSDITGGRMIVQNETGASFELFEAPVPEPASVTLLAGMGITAGLWRLRRWSARR